MKVLTDLEFLNGLPVERDDDLEEQGEDELVEYQDENKSS